MSYEVEIKFRASDSTKTADLVAALGATGGAMVLHSDLYLSHPGRNFATTDEALRLRRIGETNCITYKGPKKPGPTKTREEIEISYEPGETTWIEMTTLFERLGFQKVLEVRKSRREYQLVWGGRQLLVLLDDAGTLGEFVEIESIAEDDADLAEAQATVLSLAKALGLTEVEPRSYLRMMLEAVGAGKSD